MNKRRYMVVDHLRAPVSIKNGVVTGQLCIHGLLANYHWVRISDGHVLAFGSIPPQHYDAVHAHPKVTVLPVVNSRKALADHITVKGREGHLQALVGFGLQPHHTIVDYLEYLEERGLLGPQFVPDL